MHVLLALEIEWMNRSNNEKKVQPDDQLKIYNSILKNQVEALEVKKAMSVMHAKYTPILQYVQRNVFEGIYALMDYDQKQKGNIVFIQLNLNHLKSDNPIKIIREILLQYSLE